MIRLPAHARSGGLSVEEAIARRRSVREYRDEPITLENLSQLLWSAQGLSNDSRRRTVPSAGALYPLTVYVAVGNVRGLDPGLYRYVTQQQSLEGIRKGDVRGQLGKAALNQTWLSRASVVLVLCANYSITTGRYRDRGVRYVDMEAGHAGQNVSLQAVSLGLGSVMVGAFDDEQVRAIIGVAQDQTPLYIIPVGRGRAP